MLSNFICLGKTNFYKSHVSLLELMCLYVIKTNSNFGILKLYSPTNWNK